MYKQFKNKKLILIVIILLSLWIFFSFFSIPIFKDTALAFWVKLSYSFVCHQISDRCFFVMNHSTLLCARCIGIYSSFLFIFILGFFEKISLSFIKNKKLYLLILPLLMEIILEKLFYINMSNLIRFITGFLATIPFAMHLLNALIILENKYEQK